MQFATLASSSSGNAAYVSGGGTGLLIDAGISCRRILTALGNMDVSPAALSAILITHEHTDHIRGIETLLKRTDAVLYAPEAVADALLRQVDIPFGRIVPFVPGTAFSLGHLDITSFETPHDSVASTGYCISDKHRRVACVTDLGHVTDTVREAIYGADLIMLEANHDIRRLESGPYPWFLKKRILGDRGHLNNRDSGALAVSAATGRTRRIILAHLSRENNTPRLAYDAVAGALEGAGAELGRDLELTVAPADGAGPLYSL